MTTSFWELIGNLFTSFKIQMIPKGEWKSPLLLFFRHSVPGYNTYLLLCNKLVQTQWLKATTTVFAHDWLCGSVIWAGSSWAGLLLALPGVNHAALVFWLMDWGYRPKMASLTGVTVQAGCLGASLSPWSLSSSRKLLCVVVRTETARLPRPRALTSLQWHSIG